MVYYYTVKTDKLCCIISLFLLYTYLHLNCLLLGSSSDEEPFQIIKKTKLDETTVNNPVATVDYEPNHCSVSCMHKQILYYLFFFIHLPAIIMHNSKFEIFFTAALKTLFDIQSNTESTDNLLLSKKLLFIVVT